MDRGHGQYASLPRRSGCGQDHFSSFSHRNAFGKDAEPDQTCGVHLFQLQKIWRADNCARRIYLPSPNTRCGARDSKQRAKTLRDTQQKETTPSNTRCISCAERVVSHLQGLSVVVDALDESNDITRAGLLSLVEDMRKLTSVRRLVTSRKFPSITSDSLFKNIPHLEIRASDQDLADYIQSRFDAFKAKPHADLKTNLANSVIEAAGGMCVFHRP